MISFKDLGKMGRLGNQMFQIAATLSYAAKLNVEAKFPKWDYNDLVENKIDDSLTEDDFKKLTPTIETQFNYLPITASDDSYLQGYYQSEKYFRGDKKLLHHHFFPSVDILKQIYKKYSDVLDKKICSIHVRRGDYLERADYHTNLGITDYYKDAIKLMNPLVDKFVVFSDDIEWCKSNIYSYHEQFRTNKRFVFVEGNSEFFDLSFISLCNHHIIANSSFSWWGAYLGKDSNKRVVAPKNWFGKDFVGKWDDIYCNSWNII